MTRWPVIVASLLVGCLEVPGPAGAPDGGDDAGLRDPRIGDLLFLDFERKIPGEDLIFDRSGRGGHAVLPAVIAEAASPRGVSAEFSGDPLLLGTVPDRDELALGEQFTIEAWVARSVDACQILVTDFGPAGADLTLALDAEGHGVLFLRTLSGDVSLALEVPIPRAEWHHIAFVVGGGIARGYLDANPQTEVALAINAPIYETGPAWTLGGAPGTGTCLLVGWLDDVKLSSWPKSVAELATSMAFPAELTDLCGDALISGAEACERFDPCCDDSCQLVAAGVACEDGGVCDAAGVCALTSKPAIADVVLDFEFAEGSGSQVADALMGLTCAIESPDSVTWRAGELDIIGENRIVSATPPVFTDLQALSLEAWIAPGDETQGAGTEAARIVTISAHPYDVTLLLAQSGERFVARVRTDRLAIDGRAGIASPPVVTSGTMTHVVLTRSEVGLMTLYVDGRPLSITRAEGAPSPDPGHKLVFGNEENPVHPRFWLGTLDRVRLVGRALSGAEVGALHHAGSGD